MSNLIKFPQKEPTAKELNDRVLQKYWERENQLQKERWLATMLVIIAFVGVCILLFKYSEYIL